MCIYVLYLCVLFVKEREKTRAGREVWSIWEELGGRDKCNQNILYENKCFFKKKYDLYAIVHNNAIHEKHKSKN